MARRLLRYKLLLLIAKHINTINGMYQVEIVTVIKQVELTVTDQYRTTQYINMRFIIN